MAHVTDTIRIATDWLLDYLEGEWRLVGEVAAEWQDWDRDSKIHYLSEWGLKNSYLEVLQERARDGVLTPTQRNRYDALTRFIESQNDAVEYLFRE